MLKSLRSAFAPRAAPADAPTAHEWLLLAVIIAIALIEAALRPELSPLSVVVGMAILPTVLWRRSRPLLMVALGFGVSAGISWVRLATAVELPTLHSAAFLVLLPYALVRWGSRPAIGWGSGIIALAAALGFLADRQPAGDVIGGTSVLLAVMAAGAAARYRARARAQEIEQVKSREREQIARDLHDTVAHHVSAIAIRAQAALATSTQPHAAIDALRDIESEASKALADMRAMVRVLRTDPPERAPTAGIADLHRLQRPGGDAPAVDVQVTGDASALSGTAVATIYRLAQEAVTNARRHARNATLILVELTVDVDTIRLRVTDDGDAARATETIGGGYGLTGMAERAALLDGTFGAGPWRGRGWRVEATLPRRELQA